MDINIGLWKVTGILIYINHVMTESGPRTYPIQSPSSRSFFSSSLLSLLLSIELTKSHDMAINKAKKAESFAFAPIIFTSPHLCPHCDAHWLWGGSRKFSFSVFGVDRKRDGRHLGVGQRATLPIIQLLFFESYSWHLTTADRVNGTSTYIHIISRLWNIWKAGTGVWLQCCRDVERMKVRNYNKQFGPLLFDLALEVKSSFLRANIFYIKINCSNIKAS